MEQVRAMESPAHCTTAGGELDDNSGDLIDFSTEDLEDNSGDLIDFSTEDLENNSGDLIDFFTEVSTCLVMPASHHLCSGCAAGLPASIGVRAGGSLISASSLRVQNSASASDPAASPRLSAPSSPSSPIGPPAPPGSLVFPAPPWSVVGPSSPQDSVPTAAPRHSVPPALWTSFLPLAQPPSSVAPAPPRTFGSPPTPRSPEPRAPPWPSGSSVSPWIFGSPSPPRAPPPAAPPPSVAPLESSAFSPPWLLPPSAPPWVVMMAVVWVSHGSSCSGSLLSSPWLLPPSSPPWTLFIVLLPEDRPPPEPPPTMTLLFSLPFHAARSRLPGGGDTYRDSILVQGQTLSDLLCVLLYCGCNTPPLHGPLQTDENSGTVVAVFDLGVLDAQDVVHASQESGT
ncbi:Titin [Labeo rohita]|uniref:Titin n=1 Tax=Labeo rohita TaxID=84645 RepID=A0ABQ8MQR7_LABRO|nr:Titin [Labeo rohita]